MQRSAKQEERRVRGGGRRRGRGGRRSVVERLEARQLLSGHADLHHADDHSALEHHPPIMLEGGGVALDQAAQPAAAAATAADAAAAGPNLQITAAFLVDGGNRPIIAPAVGQMIFIRAAWTTTDLTSANQYIVRYRVDGVPADSATLTGQTGTRNQTWYRGGWYAAPGAHTIQVTIDGAGAVAETNESDNTLTFNFTPVAPSTLPQKFVQPIRGAQGIDWSIVNYADVDPRSGIRSDFRGGPFQYDGHGGIDFSLANFAQMDASVAVVAAAGGTVTAAEDGYFDRETAWNENPYNFVEITHGNGWRTRYLHLAANTITVRYGDTVAAGQLLGLVGSSGSSTDAHLHFHVYHDDATVETHFDAAAYWADPMPYQGDVSGMVMDSGISNGSVWADFKERPLEVDLFSTAQPKEAWFWLRGSNFNPGDARLVRWYRPDGSIATTHSDTVASVLRYTMTGWAIPWSVWSAQAGEWQVALTVNGVERAREHFNVTSGAGAPRMKLLQGSTYLIDGRTTELFFGYADDGDPPVPMTFTAQNHGSAPLSLTGITLPPGFSLGSALPGAIPPGGSADFVLRLDGVGAGIKVGQVTIASDDPLQPAFRFMVRGHTFGTGRPYISMTGPAVPFAPGAAPRVLDEIAGINDADSPNFNGGSLTIEMAGFQSASDRLAIRHQGSAAGQIGVSGATVLHGGVAIGTFGGGEGAAPLGIALNANATPATTAALLRNVTYGSVAPFPLTVRRYVRVTLVDDTGTVSYQPVKTIAFDTIAPAAVPFAWMNGSRLNVRFDAALPITLGASGSGASVTRGGETLTFGGATEIVVFGTSGDDHLRVDAPLGAALTFHGDAGDDTLELAGGTHTFAQDLSGDRGNLAVIVATDADVVLDASQHFRALNIEGSVELAPGGAKGLRTGALDFGASGLLDIGDNDLIVDYASLSPVGIWTGSQYDGVSGMVKAGRIISSAAGATDAIAVAEARDALNLAGSATAIFAGQAVDSTSVLVKFTWGGDANLDGKINIDDYGRIDSMIGQSGSVFGWFNGDFNYDGKINIDDYGIIDSNISEQGELPL